MGGFSIKIFWKHSRENEKGRQIWRSGKRKICDTSPDVPPPRKHTHTDTRTPTHMLWPWWLCLSKASLFSIWPHVPVDTLSSWPRPPLRLSDKTSRRCGCVDHVSATHTLRTHLLACSQGETNPWLHAIKTFNCPILINMLGTHTFVNIVNVTSIMLLTQITHRQLKLAMICCKFHNQKHMGRTVLNKWYRIGRPHYPWPPLFNHEHSHKEALHPCSVQNKPWAGF